LNGGLFEPVGGYDWRETDILIQNSIFQEVFETFNLYNFTVREDEPMEREVAVDPEMLGKVFENLLEVKDRKSKGAFYTPREIVHYMCEEALINYIDTALNSKQETSHSSFEINKPVVSREDIRIFINQGTVAANYDSAKESGTTSYTWRLPDNIRFYANEIDSALNNIKICDPAIGSGAFPVGIMTEIVKAREVLSTYLPENPARTTYNFKRHAIENSIYGVDIDSSAIDIARLRLWLSLVVDEQDYQYIKPLPNLDYRIVCGNSLVSFPDNWGSPIEKEIEGLIHLHINEANANKKKMLKDKIDEKLQTRYKNSLRAFGYEVNFDFKSIFSEVFRYKQGFDVILANPPYIQLSKVEGVPDWYKKYLKTRFNTSGGRLNTFIFFIHMAINNLNHKGNLAFIIPNTILTQEYYSATRELILKNNRLRTVVQYSELPFESAVVENVTILLSKETLDDYEIKLFTDDLFRRHLIGIASNKKFLNNKNFTITINQDEIVDKVFSVCKYSLDDYCEINQAIALKGDRSLSLRTENPQGLFYKKLDGKNIGKYSIIWDGVFLEYDLER
ncbi:MAG: N-6 DNA methylase, partial [Candidatus Methanofastidiosa archaeon]|nr:N-6 DNA methylase [Candidatus Methanofastidiosa archaeon]